MAEIGYLHSQILIDSEPKRRTNMAMVKKVKGKDSFHLYFRDLSVRLSPKEFEILKDKVKKIANKVRGKYPNDI